MNNKTVKRRSGRKGKLRLHTLWAKSHRFSAHVTEEQDWHTDVPNVRLARVFGIVLILHVVAVGGILAFKMIERTAAVPGTDGEVATGDAARAPEMREPSSLKPGAAPEEDVNVIVDDPSRLGMRHYRVRSGDNLLAVARRLEVSVSELEELNKLDKGNELYAGQVLLVPNRRISAMPEEAIHRLIGAAVSDEVIQAETANAQGPVMVAAAEVIGAQSQDAVKAPPVLDAPEPKPAAELSPASAPAPAPKAAPAPVVARAVPLESPRPASAVPALKPAAIPPAASGAEGGAPVVRPAVALAAPAAVALKPAPAPEPTASRTLDPAPSSGAKTYVVQPSDTPYGIARRHGVKLDDLMRVNGIKDPRQLRLGQELRIP